MVILLERKRSSVTNWEGLFILLDLVSMLTFHARTDFPISNSPEISLFFFQFEPCFVLAVVDEPVYQVVPNVWYHLVVATNFVSMFHLYVNGKFAFLSMHLAEL
jgi:hypothetical protein